MSNNTWPRIAVPVMGSLFRKYSKEYIEQFRKAGAGMVFLAPDRYFTPEAYQKEMDNLKYGVKLLQKEGIDCGIWVNSFGFGIPQTGTELENAPFEHITDPDGNICGIPGAPGDAFCPLDPGYLAYCTKLAKDSVKTGVRTYMLDDDLCLSVRPSLGCCCPAHMKLYAQRLGREVKPAEIKQLVFAGGPSRERTVWLQLMRDTLLDFCKAIRAAVDEVDPTVRVGCCAGFTSWDLEGADSLELSYALSGTNTRPFLRYTGAPYWYHERRFLGQSLPHIVEFTRMQQYWVKDADIDMFTENDSYPRPRYKIAASHIENFDFCMVASGENRRLKYLYDYFSNPTYESGYMNAHLKNNDRIQAMEEFFTLENTLGVGIHAPMHRMENMQLPETFAGSNTVMDIVSFNSAANLLSGVGIATTYDDTAPVVAAFGDGGRTVSTEGHKAYILDAIAARYLAARGMDVGITNLTRLGARPNLEHFVDPDDDVQLNDGERWPGCWYTADISEKATLISSFVCGTDATPGCYIYTDAKGISYYVLLTEMDGIRADGALYRSYYRQESLLAFCAKVGAPLPASLHRCPGSYLVCSKIKNGIAVAVSNCADDEIDTPVLNLADEYKTAYLIDENGSLMEWSAPDGKNLTLPTLPAWGFVAVVLQK